MFQNLKEKLFPVDELVATIKRFPLSIACSTILFIFGLLLIHDIIDDDEWMVRVFTALGCFYFWFGISRLIGESQKLSLGLEALVTVAGAGFILGMIYIPEHWPTHLFYLSPAFFLLIMVAPYLKGGDDISVWFFNRTMWFGVLVSYAALLMFAGGLSIALLAIRTLFNVDIPDELYGDIWLFAALILGPVYALSWVPERFEFTEEDCTDPPGLRFIANWISVPMIFLYLLILYAYFGKIVVQGEMPSGHLAYMITGFIGAGIATYLLAFPLREEGSAQLKLFYKIFFPALIIPIGFHAFAIWERVNAYGITEQRYTLILSVLWFAFLAFGNLKKRLPIRLIPLSLAVLFILSSFGPWGGIAVSTNSQYHQLMKVLNKNNLLVNGKPVKAEADISYEDRVSISSIVQYLCRKDKAHVIEPLFNPDKKEDWSCSSYNITEDVFGFKYVYPRRSSLFGDGSFQNDPQESFYWNSTYSNYTDVKGYDLVINNLSVYSHYTVNTPPKVWEKSYDLPDKKTLLLVYEPVEHILKFKLDNMDEVAVDVKTFLKTNNIQGSNTGDLDLVFESETLKYKMIFRNVNGDINSDDLFVKNIGFTLLIGEKN